MKLKNDKCAEIFLSEKSALVFPNDFLTSFSFPVFFIK